MKRSSLCRVVFLLAGMATLPLLPGFFCDCDSGFVRIDPGSGFNDGFNKYSWSISEFGGKIYVGTLNMDFRPIRFRDLPSLLLPPQEIWSAFEALIKTDGGEIWSYDPADGSWEKVLDMEAFVKGWTRAEAQAWLPTGEATHFEMRSSSPSQSALPLSRRPFSLARKW